jgi:MFS family permease
MSFRSLPEALRSYKALLGLPGVPALVVATCASRMAGRMFLLAIVLYVLNRFQSPALAGWVGFAAMAPGMAISPLAGALLDRMGAARAIMVDMAASALLLLVLVIAGLADGATPVVVVGLVALFSLTSPLGNAGVRTLIPALVPKEAFDQANGLDTSSYALTDVVGPALAGLLFGFAGPHPTLLTIAVLYAVASLSLLPLARRPPPARAALPRASLMQEAWAGVGYLLRHRALRGLALAYALYMASWGILLVAVPVLVIRELGAGPASDSTAGALWAISGLAGGLSALWAGHLRTENRERVVIAIGALASAAAIYPLSVSLGLAGLAIGLAIVGFLAGPIDVAVLSLRQRRTEARWFGRVLSISMSLNMSGLPLGSALGGLLLATSLPLAFAVAALVSVMASVAAYWLIPARADEATT